MFLYREGEFNYFDGTIGLWTDYISRGYELFFVKYMFGKFLYFTFKICDIFVLYYKNILIIIIIDLFFRRQICFPCHTQLPTLPSFAAVSKYLALDIRGARKNAF